MRVFVTDGENRAALAVTRSLGRAGHDVFVGERHVPSLAQASRFCARSVLYPDPVAGSDEFLDRLAGLVQEHRIDVLIPVSDITTLLLTRHRDRFPASCAIPFAGGDVVERAADKVDLVRTATRLGVPVPKTVVVCDPVRMPEHDLVFPVVVKPRRSRVRTPGGWVSCAVTYAASQGELALDLASRPRHEFPVMLQERIVGPGFGVFACYHAGRPVALFSHRRVRERPPWGGVSVLSESTALCPQAREYATRLLDEIGWQGVAMVEFKRDLRDGAPKLMEINGRFWGSLQLAIDAGVDFPALLLETVRAGRFEPQAPYRIGVRSRWLWGDFDSLLLSLFGRNGPPGRIDATPGRALLDFLKLWGRGLRYENPKLGDLAPWLHETSSRVRIAARTMTPRPSAAQAVEGAPAALRSTRGRIVTSLADVGLDVSGWNALAASSDTNSVFQTHEWVRAWWTTFQGSFEPLFVTVSEGSRVTGVAPLVIVRRSAGDRIVRFLGDGRADYCDVLAGPAAPEMLEAVFDTLDADTRWDVIELNNIPEASRTLGIVQAIGRRRGYRTLVDQMFPCPTLLIEGRASEAERLMNKPSVRRRVNYFQRNGRLSCRNLTSAANVEPYLDAFFEQHVARWGGEASSSLFLTPRNREFYRELTRQLAPAGWLLFSIVEFDDRPIAFHYGFDYNASVIWYKPSFDVAFEQHSPGIVLMRHLIGYAVAQKRRELDFTVGDEPFKRRFANSVRQTVSVHVFRDPARYLLERSRRRLVTAVRKLSG